MVNAWKATQSDQEVLCESLIQCLHETPNDQGQGVPKPEFSNQRSRDNRTLEQSRLDEATELMSKLTPKLKDALVYARVKEKQEENKSSDDTLTFSSAVGGTPVTVAPNLGARKKLNYEHPKTPKTPVSKKNISKYCQCY